MALQVTDTELAWAAGFFDGEGCVGLYHTTAYRADGGKRIGWRVWVRVETCNQEATERFGRIIGTGVVQLNRRKTVTGRSIWLWHAYNRQAGEAMRILLPYLVVKKEQAELLIAFRATVRKPSLHSTPPELFKQQSDMADSMKAMKLRA